MNKLIILMCVFAFSYQVNGQNADTEKKQLKPELVETEFTARKKVEPISEDPKVQNRTINYKKSNELISVKAYIKSLQLKRKEALMS